MANSLSAFLKENVKAIENKKVQASERFLDENNKPMLWEIQAITASENQQLRQQCTKRIGTNRAGQFVEKFDSALYQAKLIARCVVFPNLNDVDLQNSWGALSAEQLATTMLSAGEFDQLFVDIVEHCGFKTDQELVDEAKN